MLGIEETILCCTIGNFDEKMQPAVGSLQLYVLFRRDSTETYPAIDDANLKCT